MHDNGLPDSVEHVERIRQLIAEGEVDDARELIVPALERDPHNPALRLLWARIECREREHARAVSQTLLELRATHATDPLYADLHAKVASVLRGLLSSVRDRDNSRNPFMSAPTPGPLSHLIDLSLHDGSFALAAALKVLVRAAKQEDAKVDVRQPEFILDLPPLNAPSSRTAREYMQLAHDRASGDEDLARRAAVFLLQLHCLDDGYAPMVDLLTLHPELAAVAPRTVERLQRGLHAQLAERALLLLRAGRVEEAERALGDAAQDWLAGCLVMGEVAWQRGNSDEARKWLLLASDHPGDQWPALDTVYARWVETSNLVELCLGCQQSNALADDECVCCGADLKHVPLLLERLPLDDLPPAVAALALAAELDLESGQGGEAFRKTQRALEHIPDGHPARRALTDLAARAARSDPVVRATQLADSFPDGLWTPPFQSVLGEEIAAVGEGWAGVPLPTRSRLMQALIEDERAELADLWMMHAFPEPASRDTADRLRKDFLAWRSSFWEMALTRAQAALADGQFERALEHARLVPSGAPQGDAARLLRAWAAHALDSDMVALAELWPLADHLAAETSRPARLLIAEILEKQQDVAGALQALRDLTGPDVERVRARMTRRQRGEPALRFEARRAAVMDDTLERVADFSQVHGTFAIAVRRVSRPTRLGEEWGPMLYSANRRLLQTLVGVRELDGDAVFALRLIGAPDTAAAERGEITVALLARVAAADEAACRRMALQLHDILWSALPAQETQAWQYETVVDEDELGWLLCPFEATRYAEIVRREELGDDGGLYAVYPFMPGDISLHDLCRALLRQPGPAMISLHLQPATLYPWEKAALGRSTTVEDVTPWSALSLHDPEHGGPRLGHAAREQAGRDQMSFLSAQSYLMTVNVVAGAGAVEVLPETCASALFGPAQPVGAAMYGGYRIVRASSPEEEAAARRNIEGIDLERWAFTRAPDELVRLRTLVSEFEAVAAFHFPIPGQIGVPGMDLIATRPLLPPAGLPAKGTAFGESVARVRGAPARVTQSVDDRRRHLFVLGKTGVGKTTLLQNCVLQDIQAGRGVCVIDPHGDLIDDVLQRIPPERADDVIVFDPSDTERPIGLNLLEWTTEEEKQNIAEEFIGMLMRLYDPNQQGIVGPRFQHNVRNAMLTAMVRRDNTLLEVMRVLVDRNFAETLIAEVTDPMVLMYWKQQLAGTSDFHKSEILDYLVSKFNRFTGNANVRHIIGQRRTALNFRQIMDEGRILLVSLSKGKVYSENAQFLGLLLIQRLLLTALGRADVPPSQRPDFYVYVDEFQNFATSLFTTILSEGRKYGLVTVTATQYMAQLDYATRQAIFGNIGTLISFRLGLPDAEVLAPEMYPTVSQDDLINLPRYTAAARMLVNGMAERPFTIRTHPVLQPPDAALAARIRHASRMKYGADVAAVRADIEQRMRWTG